MENTTKYHLAMALAAAEVSVYAASGVIELEIPGMNEEMAARIVDFCTNACPATIAQNASPRLIDERQTLDNSVWFAVNVNAALYHFFKVVVETK